MPTHIPDLYSAAPFIEKFQERVFVVKIGGEVLQDEKRLASLSRQLMILWRIGIHPVIVHGAGPQLDAALREVGHEPRKIDGRRVTDERTLELAKRTFCAANLQLVAAFSRQGIPALGLAGADGNTLIVRRRPPKQVNGELVDYGFVGDPVALNPGLLKLLISADYVPVVCSLGIDADGVILNINADTVASEVAVGLGAAKLIFVTDKPGVLHDPKDNTSVYSILDAAEVERLTADGVISGGMSPKVTAGFSALRRGVERAHIIGVDMPEALLEETFTNQGCGTMLVLQKE